MKFLLITLLAIIAIEMSAQKMPTKLDIMTDEIRKELNASYDAIETGGVLIAGGVFISLLSTVISIYDVRAGGSGTPGVIGVYLGGVISGIGGLKIKQGAKRRKAVLLKYGY